MWTLGLRAEKHNLGHTPLLHGHLDASSGGGCAAPFSLVGKDPKNSTLPPTPKQSILIGLSHMLVIPVGLSPVISVVISVNEGGLKSKGQVNLHHLRRDPRGLPGPLPIPCGLVLRGQQNVPVSKSPPTWAEGSGGHHTGTQEAGGPAVTWRCPRAAAHMNSSRTPGAQPPGPLELRGLCDPSQPREREALAQWGRGRSPTWNGGQERVTLREQRAVAIFTCPSCPHPATWPRKPAQPLSSLALQGVGWG